MNVFIGRVVENKYYSKNGYIDVLAFQMSMEHGFASQLRKEFELKDIAQDLLPDYNDGLTGNGMNICRCRILSPLGAGENYGMFSLPQVNSVGLILQLDEYNREYWSSDDRYIWLGGLYGGKMYGDVMTLPNDDTESELLEHDDNPYTDENDTAGTEDTIIDSPYRNEGMFLIKLKTSKTDADVENEKNQQNVHYKYIPSNNEFIMRKTRTTLRHNTYDDENSRVCIADLTLNGSKTQLSRFTAPKNSKDKDANREEQIAVFDGTKIKIQFLNKKTGVDRWLQFDNDKAELAFDAGNGNNVKMLFDKNGNMSLNVSNDCKINVTGNANIDVTKNATLKSTGDTKIEATGSCEVKGLKVKVEGTVSCDVKAPKININNGSAIGLIESTGVAIPGAGSGPFCGLPACLLTGVPHTSSQFTMLPKPEAEL